MALFPVQDCPRLHSKEPRRLSLIEVALEAATPEMLAQRAGLKIWFLWFQALKRDGGVWQKGNASMRMSPIRKIESAWEIFRKEARKE